MKGKLKVCRVEYETKNKINWKANVIAYSMEDAIAYLRKNVAEFDRYTGTTMIGDVDAIETTAYNDYFVSETKVVETVVEKTPDEQQQPDTGDVFCPWCDKQFKNKNTLGTHIKKFHMEG